jgi:hypothetical protein
MASNLTKILCIQVVVLWAVTSCSDVSQLKTPPQILQQILSMLTISSLGEK